MKILSCEKLTIEQAIKLNLDSTTDPDPCLSESIQNYKCQVIEPSDYQIQCVNDLLELSQEYKTAYENMDENEVKCWDYKMLTKQDMFKLWKETDAGYQNERTKCVNKPYRICWI